MKCKAYAGFYEDAAALYPKEKIYGPYLRKDGRKVVILYDGKKRSGRQYARIKLEIKLGRRLTPQEEVDHIDGNFKNDRFKNLQLVSPTQNRLKQAEQTYGKPRKIACKGCGKTFRISYSKQSKSKFCSQSCTSNYYGANQYGNKITGYSSK